MRYNEQDLKSYLTSTKMLSILLHQKLGSGLNPGALAQDLIEVQGNLLLLNQSLNLSLVSLGQDPHQGLGGEPVLGSLFVVTLGHVSEHLVSSLVNVMDDLTKVGLEVSLGKVLQVSQSG